MHIYLDSGNTEEINIASQTGLLNGVTTNPTLLHTNVEKTLKSICQTLRKQTTNFTVSAEVMADTHTDMIKQGLKLSKIDKNIIIKVPMTAEGLLAVQAFKKKNIRCNVTLIFTANQALLAAKAGAYIVSPFLGRLEDSGQDSQTLLEEIKEIYHQHNIRTLILAASIRTPRHVTVAALSGADIATVPFTVFSKLFTHPLTDKGIEQFEHDWTQQ